MRRITLALALVGAVAAGCSGGAGSTASSNNQKRGVTGSQFTLSVRGETQVTVGTTIYMVPAGGIVTSTPAGIDCGIPGVGAPHTACSAQFTYDAANPVVITPANDVVGGVQAYAGACSGQAPCSVLMTSDKLLLVRFAANTTGLGGHPNFSDGQTHGAEYAKWANGDPTAYHCTSCHGAQGQGAGTAPSCSQCHPAPPLPPTSAIVPAGSGLVATIDSINVTSPVTVKFHLADTNGNPVDLAGVASNNLPISNCGHGNSVAMGCSNTTVGFAVAYYQTVSNGYPTPANIVTPFTVNPGKSGSPSMFAPYNLNDTTNQAANGLLTADTTPGHYIYKFPSVVAINVAKSVATGYTHEIIMFATRQENTSTACTAATSTANGPFSACAPSADTAKTYTAVNVAQAFDAASPAAFLPATAKREIISSGACAKCHDGFRPKQTGLVSNAFHNGNKVEGWICNVCHNPARTSNPWANSSQHVHRIHAYNEESLPAYACVDQNTTNFDVVGLNTVGVPAYAGGGVQVTVPSSATDVSFCNTTALASLWANPATAKVTVKQVAFDGVGLDITYPQDVRNCQECHDPAGNQYAQYKTNVSPTACDSCHAGTSSAYPGYGFAYWYRSADQASIIGELANQLPYFVPGAVAGDAAGNLDMAHPKLAVSPPDPQGCLLVNGAEQTNCNGNTNAAYLANAGQVPVGADTWAYSVSNVQLDAGGHPQVTFQILRNGSAIGPDYCTTVAGQGSIVAQTDPTVIFANTYGGPSIYAAFSVAEDGITAPADFNATVSGYLPAICAEGHTALKGTSKATLSIDGSNNWTVTFAYTANLSTAGIGNLTGGIGYTYNPSSTPPITQTNLSGYPVTIYNITGPTTGSGTKVYGVSCTPAAPCATKTGGLIVPAKDATMVAQGYTGRRVIVANAKCDACHARIGAKPTFHAGQRNDAPTCSFCHTANQGSGGWSADASSFIHGIHGTDKRTVNLTWEEGCNIGATFVTTTAANGQYSHYGDCMDNVTGQIVAPRFFYPEVTYPGILSCSECHTDGFFAQTQANAASLLWSTTAYGTAAYGTNPNTAYPWPTANGVNYVNPSTIYGAGFSFNATTGATTAAASTTLVNSPIASSCFSCHDDAAAVTHMTSAGGHLYEARSTAQANMASEQCFTCHGPGAGLDVAKVHP
jgi:OmcA/MtrC family decaheme c-type cytochrome